VLGFVLRLFIAVPLFLVLLSLSVLALALEFVSPSAASRPSPLDVIGSFVNRA